MKSFELPSVSSLGLHPNFPLDSLGQEESLQHPKTLSWFRYSYVYNFRSLFLSLGMFDDQVFVILTTAVKYLRGIFYENN